MTLIFRFYLIYKCDLQTDMAPGPGSAGVVLGTLEYDAQGI